MGKVRPPEDRATAKSELTESSGEFSDVAKFAGKVRPPGEATYRTALKSEVAEYSSKLPTSCWENIAGRVVGHRTVAEMAEKSGREC